MSFSNLYALRARIQPALTAVMPLAFLLLTLLPGQPILATTFITLLGTIGGMSIANQLGRDRGSKKQPSLWKNWGGPPTTRLLRHHKEKGDITLALGLREQIEDWNGDPLPTKEEEEASPEQADAIYGQVTKSLIEATRDTTKFPLVLEENINYGFRRNLWGLRPIGGTIAVTLTFISWTLLLLTIWGRPWPDPWWNVFVNPDSTAVIRLAAAFANTALAIFWLFWVKPSWIKPMADKYAMQLMESVQTLRGN